MEGLVEGRIEWCGAAPIGITEVDLAYIAGLFDGEGCVSIDKATNQGDKYPRFQLHTTIHLREGNVLKELQDVFGGSFKVNASRSEKHATTWRWRLTSNGASKFLMAVYPFLRFKKKQAFWGIHFQSLMTTKGGKRTEAQGLIQQDHYMLIRQYNKKGVTKWTGL